MKTLIIIPTYNEEPNIKDLTNEILKQVKNVSILFVDDNSSDNTRKIINSLKEANENILSLYRDSKMGLASAYIDAITFGLELGFDSFIQMDADFSHNPKYLPIIIDKLKENDVVIASRNIKGGTVVGWSLLRNIISKGGSIYSRLILNCPIKDLTGGFNGWRKEIIQKIDLNKIISKGYSFQIEMKYKAYKNKAKIIEFPIIFEDRKYGKSKMSKKIFFEAMLNVFKIKLKGG